MNFVLGTRGRLGQVITSSLPVSQIRSLDRSVYSEWWRDDSVDDVSRFFERWTSSGGVIYVAAGIIDPIRPQQDHYQVNHSLAKNIIEGATKLGLKVVTFGTVMERIVGDKSMNPYYSSKTKLGHYVENFSATSNLALHIRLHTLFGGGPPDKFMFLGQVLNSIKTGMEFKMTPGVQLREYHHIDDEVVAIFRMVDSDAHGAVELSHGAPVSLRDLSKYIFEAFNCTRLLKIGALPEPVNDNYGVLFERSPVLYGMAFRETLPAVAKYLRSCEA